MRVDVLGGGPAGLYASLLLKKNHPKWDITLYERNPEGATYGWGVVFSDRTLTSLREADYPTFEEITENFVLWDAIDIHIKDQLVRCNGHAFAGVGRRHLLKILQNRCEQLGVILNFQTEMRVDCLPDEPDLVIAADGVNSLTRERYASKLLPRTSTGRAKYIWFGTDKVYDAFTFVFRESEFGLFQVHAYPYDATTSTFIVECAEETWRRAKLDLTNEEESIRFCEDLFCFHLGSHRLLSNNSSWLTFITLRNRHWSHENIVLLGDAVHTAHFSIGSGTKLAMDDAIGLAEAFETHDDIQAAFRHYEQDRKPRVEILQQAARESQRYFETVSRYYDFEPIQFGFHLLTRSGRINWDNLRTRDHYFIDDVERWFRANAVVENARPEPLIAPPAIYTPMTLRDLSLPNRVVISQSIRDVSINGIPGDNLKQDFGRLAGSGAGILLSEPVAVAPEGRITPGSAGLYEPEHGRTWREITAHVEATGLALTMIELSHAGQRGATRHRRRGVDLPLTTGVWPLIAPSPISYSLRNQTPKAMDASDFDRVREAFINATRMANEAGFDLLQLDMSHGYLLGSFLSPLTNQRSDDYGGSCEGRMKYPLEIFDAVRTTWPEHKPISVALNASDWKRGGLYLSDAVKIATRLKEHGCDLIAVRAGQTVIDDRPNYDFETLAYYTDVIRNDAHLPVIATGYMTTSNQMNTLLAGGRADLCLYTPPPGRSVE